MPPFQTPAWDGFCGDLIDLCVYADVRETGQQSVDKEQRRRQTSAALKRRQRDKTTGKFRAGVGTQEEEKKKSKVLRGRHGGGGLTKSTAMHEEEGEKKDTKGLKRAGVVPYLTFALSRGRAGGFLRIQPERGVQCVMGWAPAARCSAAGDRRTLALGREERRGARKGIGRLF